MRKPADTDFFVDVEEVGVFRFGRRTYGDRLKIRAEFLRLVREFGEDEDAELSTHAAVIAAHKVLCVEAPEGWESLESIDLVAIPDAEDKIFAIFAALKEKEDSFRKSAKEDGEAARA
jgi:hypothetical protein